MFKILITNTEINYDKGNYLVCQWGMQIDNRLVGIRLSINAE